LNEQVEKESGLMKKTVLPMALILALLFSAALFDIYSVAVELPEWAYAASSPEPTTSPTPSTEPTSTPETQHPPLFPTALIIAVVITITVEGIGLLIYFKKRKR
jgi:hypothetical protein